MQGVEGASGIAGDTRVDTLQSQEQGTANVTALFSSTVAALSKLSNTPLFKLNIKF